MNFSLINMMPIFVALWLISLCIVHAQPSTTVGTRLTTSMEPSVGPFQAVGSTPDIYPSNKTEFVGEVLITIVNNQAHATVYYTTDGTSPSYTNSTAYTEPFSITQAAGQHGKKLVLLRAIAASNVPGIADSVAAERLFTVIPAAFSPPRALPQSDTNQAYRGGVTVRLLLDDETIQLGKLHVSGRLAKYE